jgi:ankyrin repeat protein
MLYQKFSNSQEDLCSWEEKEQFYRLIHKDFLLKKLLITYLPDFSRLLSNIESDFNKHSCELSEFQYRIKKYLTKSYIAHDGYKFDKKKLSDYEKSFSKWLESIPDLKPLFKEIFQERENPPLHLDIIVYVKQWADDYCENPSTQLARNDVLLDVFSQYFFKQKQQKCSYEPQSFCLSCLVQDLLEAVGRFLAIKEPILKLPDSSLNDTYSILMCRLFITKRKDQTSFSSTSLFYQLYKKAEKILSEEGYELPTYLVLNEKAVIFKQAYINDQIKKIRQGFKNDQLWLTYKEECYRLLENQFSEQQESLCSFTYFHQEYLSHHFFIENQEMFTVVPKMQLDAKSKNESLIKIMSEFSGMTETHLKIIFMLLNQNFQDNQLSFNRLNNRDRSGIPFYPIKPYFKTLASLFVQKTIGYARANLHAYLHSVMHDQSIIFYEIVNQDVLLRTLLKQSIDDESIRVNFLLCCCLRKLTRAFSQAIKLWPDTDLNSIFSTPRGDGSFLMLAARSGAIGILKKLIVRGASLDIVDQFNHHALYHALESRQLESALFLVDEGSSLLIRSHLYNNLLILAIQAGYSILVKKMLTKLWPVDRYGDLFYEGAFEQSIKEKQIPCDSVTPKVILQEAFHYAIRNKKLFNVNQFIAHSADSLWMELLLEPSEICRKTALHVAIESNNLILMSLFLENKASVAQKSFCRSATPLMIAAQQNSLFALAMMIGERKLELLVNKKLLTDAFLYFMQFNPNNKEHTDLLEMRQTMGRFLLEQNIPINEQDEFGRTALHWSIIHGEKELIKLFLDKNAAFNIPDAHGLTAQDFACRYSREHHDQTVETVVNKIILSKVQNEDDDQLPLSTPSLLFSGSYQKSQSYKDNLVSHSL